jgi:predicted nucleic acid-binding protein
MIVVSDTTPIISLMKAGQLDLLRKLFDDLKRMQ